MKTQTTQKTVTVDMAPGLFALNWEEANGKPFPDHITVIDGREKRTPVTAPRTASNWIDYTDRLKSRPDFDFSGCYFQGFVPGTVKPLPVFGPSVPPSNVDGPVNTFWAASMERTEGILNFVAAGKTRHKDGKISHSASMARWVRDLIPAAISEGAEQTLRINYLDPITRGEEIDPAVIKTKLTTRSRYWLRAVEASPIRMIKSKTGKRHGTEATESPLIVQDSEGQSVICEEAAAVLDRKAEEAARLAQVEATYTRKRKTEFLADLYDPKSGLLTEDDRKRLRILFRLQDDNPGESVRGLVRLSKITLNTSDGMACCSLASTSIDRLLVKIRDRAISVI